MGLTATSSSKEYEQPPVGVHPARCYMMVDLGTQSITWNEETKWAHKVRITWELLGEDRMADGRPFSISKRFTVSTHEKSVLRPFLEAWRGRPFTQEEIAAFDLTTVVGAPCLINVTHDVGKDGKTYANVAGCMPIPKGMAKPEAVNTPVIFDIDNPDMKVFETLGKKLQADIMSAREWTKKAQRGAEDDVPWQDEPESDPVPF